MKTRNIRVMMLMCVAAMAVGVSAQKNVLKAFDKVEKSKEVVVKKAISKSSSDMPGKWRANGIEFNIPKADAARKLISMIDEAFTKDSKKDNVTYYTRMNALGEKPTEKEKDAYKKILVRRDNAWGNVVIGSDPSYHVLVMRCHSGVSCTVVALEWKLEPGYGYLGKIYEFEYQRDQNEVLKEEPFFSPYSRHWQPETRNDGITTRMYFYRDTYNGEDNSENSALLLNMTEYLSANKHKASVAEQNIVISILGEMNKCSKAKVHREIINQCMTAFVGEKEVKSEGVKRIELYIRDFNECRMPDQQNEVLDAMAAYVFKWSKHSIDARTSNQIYELLMKFKHSVRIPAQQNRIADIMRTLER